MIKSIRTLRSQRNSLIACINRMKDRLESRGHVLSVSEKLSLKERIVDQKVKLLDVSDSLQNEAVNLFFVAYTTKNGYRKTKTVYLHAA